MRLAAYHAHIAARRADAARVRLLVEEVVVAVVVLVVMGAALLVG